VQAQFRLDRMRQKGSLILAPFDFRFVQCDRNNDDIVTPDASGLSVFNLGSGLKLGLFLFSMLFIIAMQTWKKMPIFPCFIS
jgi:hypothetical protein